MRFGRRAGGAAEMAIMRPSRRRSGWKTRWPSFSVCQAPKLRPCRKLSNSKAPADELKAKLAKLRGARKEKEAALEKSQEDLRKVLSVRQEAAAVLAGLLK